MITQLRKHARVDALKNDVRSGGVAWGRYIYLALLSSLFLFILNFFAGSYIFLRADGLVIKDSYTVSPLYTARIKKVFVKRGDTVKRNQPLLELESATLMLQLAQISTEVANLANKTAQIKARTTVARALLPTARKHAGETAKTLYKLTSANRKDLVTSRRFEQAMSDKINAKAKLSELEAESSVFSDEALEHIEAAQKDAQKALDDLKRLYNNGKVNAPVNGTVGTQLVTEGDVLLVGKPLLQVFAGDAYILAFLPKRYLFTLSPGQTVTVQSGSIKAIGTIEKLLPVAASLPKEFQNSIKPTGRQQLVRILLPKGHPFVISQNIIIKGHWPFSVSSS